jgi:hypothetical protein
MNDPYRLPLRKCPRKYLADKIAPAMLPELTFRILAPSHKTSDLAVRASQR